MYFHTTKRYSKNYWLLQTHTKPWILQCNLQPATSSCCYLYSLRYHSIVDSVYDLEQTMLNKHIAANLPPTTTTVNFQRYLLSSYSGTIAINCYILKHTTFTYKLTKLCKQSNSRWQVMYMQGANFAAGGGRNAFTASQCEHCINYEICK